MWSREEAVAKLDDPALAVSAAVRLVRLTGATPLCVPDPLSDEVAEHLRVLRVSNTQWAFGHVDQRRERRLRSPVLLDANGTVTPLGEGADEEVLVLWASPDVEVFPHLLIAPLRVRLLAEEQPAIVLASPKTLRFELRQQDEYPYVALVLPGADSPVEVARYAWDPYELAFTGPARDKLPDPPGGRFKIDLAQSTGLQPMGGEIDEPDAVEPPPPPDQEPLPY